MTDAAGDDERAASEAVVAARAAIYQAERSDLAAILNGSMALIGAGIAYTVGTVAFFESLTEKMPAIIVSCLPLPLWLIVAYIAILLSSAIVRTSSILLVESRLFEDAKLDAGRQEVGLMATRMVTDPRQAHWSHGGLGVLTYGGVLAIVAGHTFYMLVADGRLGWARIFFAVIYTAMGVIIILAWWRAVVATKDHDLISAP